MQKLARSLKRISSRKSEQGVTPKASSGLGNSRTSAVLADAGSQPQSPTAIWQRGSSDIDKQPSQSGPFSNGYYGGDLQNHGDEAASDANANEPQNHETFLAAFDLAQVNLCNSLFGGSATCMADTRHLAVAPWNRVPGYLGHLNSSQERALRQMREWFPESRGFHTDHDVLRFLRAREFDLPKTREMYAKYIREYRGKLLVSPNPMVRPTHGPYNMDVLDLFPRRSEALTAKMVKLMEWFLHTVAFGLDLQGRPVVYFRPLDILRQNMAKHVPVADRLAFQTAANETLNILLKLASQRAGFHIENMIQVLDLGGLSPISMVTHMRSPDSQKEWQHNLDYNPEGLHQVIIINAPTGISMVWKVASYFLPAATVQKTVVHGKDYQSELFKVIGKQNMPSCYGGDCPYEWPEHKPIKELIY